MKKTIIVFLVLFKSFCCVVDATAQDLTLWYNTPAAKWTDALPIGNGRLGAMLFGGVKEDRIQFNEETLWTGTPRDYNRKAAYKYLDSIRGLLFAGRQKEAEDLAGREFMGLKSGEGNRKDWDDKILNILKLQNNPSKETYNDASWQTITMPNYNGWEAAGMEGLDGAVWFRKTVDLPASFIGKDILLDLNKIADRDITFINGVQVGTQYNEEARIYNVPASILKEGKNTIAVLVINYNNKGGLMGYKDTTKAIGFYPKDGGRAKLLSLNGAWKYFVQNDDTPAIGQYQAAYQPFGDLWLRFNVDENKVQQYKRYLDISKAIATTTYQYDGVQYKREYLASVPQQVLAVHCTASQPGKISFDVSLSTPHKKFVIQKVNGNTIALKVQVKDGALRGAAYIRVYINGGTITTDEEKVHIADADEATLYLAAATNYKNYKDVSANPQNLCAATLSGVNDKPYAQVADAHIKEYQSYFNTFSIYFSKTPITSSISSIGGDAEAAGIPTDLRLAHFAKANDPSFAALYVQYARYLLISSSRPGTRPANLQGIWNDLLSPPWGSKYTTNINAEMNYWPAEPLNLSAMHQPLFQMIQELSVTGAETAKQYYNAPGWVLHHNTDLWRGTAPINASNHGIWVTGAAWLCQHLWEHYLFTQDKKFLKDTAYPIMKSAAQFFNAFLVKDPQTGYLISTPSNSPEQGGLVAGPTMDHQIIRALFQNTINAADILKTDAAFAKALQEKHQQIAPDKIGRYGQLQEWMQDVDDTTNKHRHVSHLWAVYPGAEINWETTPDKMKAARQSLIYRGDAATGWSLGWKINLWARFKDGDHVFKLIQMLLSPAVGGAGSYNNLFDAHPPFQIDGNFGGAAGIVEMLVQSHTKYVDILPALPAALPNGSVRGIKVRGGFLVDINWQNGSLQSVTVRSNAGQSIVLRYKDKVVPLPTVVNAVYKFNGLLNRE